MIKQHEPTLPTLLTTTTTNHIQHIRNRAFTIPLISLTDTGHKAPIATISFITVVNYDVFVAVMWRLLHISCCLQSLLEDLKMYPIMENCTIGMYRILTYLILYRILEMTKFFITFWKYCRILEIQK